LTATALGKLLALGLVFCAAAAAQDPASVALEECATQVEQAHQREEMPGLKEIEERCPELKTILDNSPYAGWFPEDWWGPMLSPDSLRELGRLIAEENREAAITWKADTGGVAPALATLGEEEKEELTWWDRVREWLRTRLQSESEDTPNWLIEWLEKLDEHERMLQIIGYALFALIILAAGWIVFNELKASGVFAARAVRLSRSDAARAVERSGRVPTLDDIERSDPANRPSMLLALLLGAVGRLEDRIVDQSFTHRELAARVTLEKDWQRSAFGQLLRCAERVRYAPELPARGEIDEAVIGGRRLLESIARPAGAATA